MELSKCTSIIVQVLVGLFTISSRLLSADSEEYCTRTTNARTSFCRSVCARIGVHNVRYLIHISIYEYVGSSNTYEEPTSEFGYTLRPRGEPVQRSACVDAAAAAAKTISAPARSVLVLFWFVLSVAGSVAVCDFLNLSQCRLDQCGATRLALAENDTLETQSGPVTAMPVIAMGLASDFSTVESSRTSRRRGEELLCLSLTF